MQLVNIHWFRSLGHFSFCEAFSRWPAPHFPLFGVSGVSKLQVNSWSPTWPSWIIFLCDFYGIPMGFPKIPILLISSLKNHMTYPSLGYPMSALPSLVSGFVAQLEFSGGLMPDGTSKAQHWMILDHSFKKHGQNDRVFLCVELQHQVSCISIPLAIEGGARPHAAITRSSNLSWEDETWRRCSWNCYWRFENCWKKTANLVNFQLADLQTPVGVPAPNNEQTSRKTAESADVIGFYG